MTTNIKDLPEDKLLELLCTRVHGWQRLDEGVSAYDKCEWVYPENGRDYCVRSYNPLAPTIQGKGQAMELVERFNIHMYPPTKLEPRWWAVIRHSGGGESENLQRAIVLAAVASVCGEEVEL